MQRIPEEHEEETPEEREEANVRLAELEPGIHSFLAAEEAREMTGLYVIVQGGLREDDVLRMLRGQLLSREHMRCCDEENVVDQRDLGSPLDPVPCSRRRLQCPLHERAQEGILPVPCGTALESAEFDEDEIAVRGRGTLLKLFLENKTLRPCESLHWFVLRKQDRMLGLPPYRPRLLWEPEPAPPADLPERRQALLAAGADVGVEGLEAQVRFLMEGGRLLLSEVGTLWELSVPVTDAEWLPCRDDRERDTFYQEGEATYVVRPHGLRCPLQVRALLGDRTVPCAEALQARYPEALVAEARRLYPDGLEGLAHRPELPLPRSWSRDDEEPGGPNDVVRLLGLRPCHIIGRLLAARLPGLLEELAQDEEGQQKYLRVLQGESQEAPPADGAEWAVT